MQALSNAALSLPIPGFQSQYPVNLARPGEPGTPILNDVPIDPALGGTQTQIMPATRASRSSSPYQPLRQGPAGDPYASDGTQNTLEEQWPAPGQPSTPPPRPNLKRKRRAGKPPAQNKPECTTCHRHDHTSSHTGQPEGLVTCATCGLHAHPSCLELGAAPASIITSYAWTCLDCKACEVCKTNDEKVIICDHCDRAWHPGCLDPPLADPPEGIWHCPLCPPSQAGTPQATASREYEDVDGDGETEDDAHTTEREDDEVSEALAPVKSRPRAPKSPTAKRRNRAQASSSRKRPKLRINPPAPLAPAPAPPPPVTPTPTQAKVTLKLRLTQQQLKEEPPPKPFEGILGPEDADTARTAIAPEDKQRFEKSRLAAEAKLPPPVPAALTTPSTPGPSTPTPGPLLSARPLRSQSLLLLHSTPTITLPATPAPAPATPGGSFFAPDGLRIKVLRFGQFDIDTWYDAPFPEEYSNLPDSRLWMCEFCLKYMKSKFSVGRHRLKCKARHPPGDEIYRDGAISVFEVDGRRNKIYCQNLCMLSKMFLSQKSLFYDVEPFLFYVMTEVDENGAHFVGYFSKEKSSPKDYNLSCIMTLPIRQRKGWGQFLIDFSYLLSKKEGRTGTPERPLSQLGALSYKNYWTLSIMRYLNCAADHVTLQDISKATSITVEDVYVTLRDQGMIQDKHLSLHAASPAKLPRGRRSGHGSRRGMGRRQSSNVATTNATPEPGEAPPVVIPKQYSIVWDRSKVANEMAKWYAKGYVRVKPERLEWSPYLLSRDARSAAEQELEIPTHSTHEPAERRESALGDFAELALAKRSQEKQMEEDLALATKLAASEETPGRLRRTRSSAAMVLAEPPSPSPVRTRSARRRPATRARTSRRGADDDEDDEAAAEPATSPPPRRTLRSRSSHRAANNVVPDSPAADEDEDEDGDGSSPPPIRPSRAGSPRKRRRIESDPPTPSEMELEPEREPMSTSASTNDGTGTPPLGAGVPVPVVGVVEAEQTYGATVVVPSPSPVPVPASKESPFAFKPDAGGIGPFYNVSATRHVREDTPTEGEDLVMDDAKAKEGIGDGGAPYAAANGIAAAAAAAAGAAEEEWDDEADAEGEEDPDA